MDWTQDSFWIVRLVFQRGLAVIYLVAFVSALNQFRPLLGEKGLLPAPDFLKRVKFWQAPSIFHLHYSDRFFACTAWTGIIISLLAVFGITETGSVWLSMIAWFVVYVLYLSIVNVGQTFYSFGWESMLLEAGFFAAFLGPASVEPSFIPILILRWMLFRTEIGAGLIKLRGDACWRNLTCLFYHHETQPLPNPLSWYFHRIPKPFLRGGVAFSHIVQVIVPFGLFAPQPIASIAGALIILHQLILIIGGNYSWLNWLTVILVVTAFSDSIITSILPVAVPHILPRPEIFNVVLYALGGLTIVLSIKPALNLLSRHQLMNYNYNPFHLVGAYGAFGSVTKERYEIVIEGTRDAVMTPHTQWRAYEFKGKPGDTTRRPPQVAPYHLRLDWLMWFLPFSVTVTEHGIHMYGYEVWFARFIQKLLEGDRTTMKLLKSSPFSDSPPTFIRARYYLYHFTTPKERKETSEWWKRELIDEYVPPVTLTDLQRINI